MKTRVYTPFPNYEREVAVGGAVTERTTYAIARQMVAVQKKVETAGLPIQPSSYRQLPTPTDLLNTDILNTGYYPNSCFRCRINTDSTTPMARNRVMSELPP